MSFRSGSRMSSLVCITTPSRARRVRAAGEDGGHAFGVFRLHPVIVGEDDRVLALEIVVGRAEGDIGRRGDVAHRGGIEAVAPEAGEGGVPDAVAGGLALR